MNQNTRVGIEKVDLDTDRMPIGCIVWDEELNILSWNTAAETIFGYSRKEVVGKNAFDFIVPPDEIPYIKVLLHELISGNMNAHNTNQNLTKNGDRITCEWFNTPLTNSDGKVYAILSMIQDISDQVSTNRELENKVKELDRKNEYEEALINILQLLAESNDLKAVMENAVDAMKRNIPRADNVSIYMVQDNDAVIQAYRGYPEWFMERVRKIPYPKGFTWKTIIDGRSRYIVNVENDDAIGTAGREVGTRSYVSLPLYHNSIVVGVININSYSRDAFTQDEIDFLERMKIHIETAINNAKQVDALKKSEEKFSSFMNHLPGLAFIKDINQNYLYVNRTFLEMFNFRLSEVIDKGTHDVWSEKLSEKFDQSDKEVLKTQREIQFIEDTEYQGSVLSWLVNKFPIFNGGDTTLYIGGIATDISELKRTQEKLRHQAELLDLADDAIVTFDLSKYIIFCNKSAEMLFNISDDGLSSLTLDGIFSDDSDNLEHAFRTVKNNGVWKGELTHVVPGGKPITVMSTWNLVSDYDMDKTIIFAVFSDISEKKEMEKQLYHSQRMESIGILAGGLAHDLNNIFQPIVMSSNLIREAVSKQKDISEEWLDIIGKSIQRASGLVNQVLAFSRGEEGEYKPFDIKQLIRDLVNIARETFPKSIKIKTEMPDKPIHLYGNLVQIHQVLMNLCINARDAMPDGGVLTISLQKRYVDDINELKNPSPSAGEYVVIRVEDTGEGISNEDMELIFDPFFTTKEVGKGTGLGLSTVYKIVMDHNGFIDVLSEVGSGTAFNVYLPIVDNGNKPESEVALTQDTEKRSGKGELILIVDDEQEILDITKMILEHSGYKVITTSTGDEALGVFMNYQESIELVIIDIMLPGIYGNELLDRMLEVKSGLKVIFSSGVEKEAESLLSNYSRQSAVLLTKPYTSDKLLDKVTDLLNK